ncbi:MAG: hypothetical protein IH999_05195 [Proteobacteria bacterium]|nr:hypothetical protein [Pseudomonadota bacterium]
MNDILVQVGLTVLGGFIAGAAGIVTARHIHRKERETAKRTIATALYKEMENLLAIVEPFIRKSEDPATTLAQVKLWETLAPHTQVYDSNLDKLGLLGVSRVGEIVSFYTTIKRCVGIGRDARQNPPPPEIVRNLVDTLRSACDTGHRVKLELAPLIDKGDGD